jgi:hypothetical protein
MYCTQSSQRRRKGRNDQLPILCYSLPPHGKINMGQAMNLIGVRCGEKGRQTECNRLVPSSGNMSHGQKLRRLACGMEEGGDGIAAQDSAVSLALELCALW